MAGTAKGQPAVERLGFLFNPETAPYAEPFLRQAEAAALSLGISLNASRFHDDFEIERTIAELGRARGGGLIVLPDPFTNTRSALIIGLAAKHRVPAVYAWRFQAISGGLISYGVDLAESFRASASYVDRILRGEKPASLPVQAPTKFSLVVNLKTAKALGLTVPPGLPPPAEAPPDRGSPRPEPPHPWAHARACYRRRRERPAQCG